jgi:hypothetical protein
MGPLRPSATILAIASIFAPGRAFANDAAHPTVVELYQSQGCSSCPPAIANINAIADRPDVLALTFAVTYWDQLGWKDTFARPEFTERQWAFAHANGRGGVATPQTIVNGRVFTNGGDRKALTTAIRAADRGTSGPTIHATAGKVTISGSGANQPATVWLVRYDPRVVNVPIRAGENSGRTIAHRNVVRSLSAIGKWTGREAVLRLPAVPGGALRSAILVQSGTAGPIIAAVKL